MKNLTIAQLKALTPTVVLKCTAVNTEKNQKAVDAFLKGMSKEHTAENVISTADNYENVTQSTLDKLADKAAELYEQANELFNELLAYEQLNIIEQLGYGDLYCCLAEREKAKTFRDKKKSPKANPLNTAANSITQLTRIQDAYNAYKVWVVLYNFKQRKYYLNQEIDGKISYPKFKRTTLRHITNLGLLDMYLIAPVVGFNFADGTYYSDKLLSPNSAVSRFSIRVIEGGGSFEVIAHVKGDSGTFVKTLKEAVGLVEACRGCDVTPEQLLTAVPIELKEKLIKAFGETETAEIELKLYRISIDPKIGYHVNVNVLSAMFVFRFTKEGEVYWMNIHDRLESLKYEPL